MERGWESGDMSDETSGEGKDSSKYEPSKNNNSIIQGQDTPS